LVAEGSEKSGRDAAEARRRQRADWFGKSLGAEWVEVEPGIYQHQPSPAPARLDDELIDAIPTSERDTEGESTAPTKQ
jgi:hypothetical protein